MGASMILMNGKVVTMDTAQPNATAVALRDGKILAVGHFDDFDKFIDSETEVINLQGRTVTPGLVDAHVHFHHLALTFLRVDLFEVPSLAEALEQVRARAAETAPGNWIEGRGWKHTLWDDPSFPTAAQLDAVTTKHPIVLISKSGHMMWVNTAALKIAGVDDSTPDPDGGQIQRDAQGRATGILLESAMYLVRKHVPLASAETITNAMRQAQQHCWEKGLTGIHDYDGRSSFLALQTLHSAGELGLRVIKNIPASRLEYVIEAGIRSGFGDDFLRIGGIKQFADGALGPRTALMVDPYEDEPDNRGIAVTDKEEMYRAVSLGSKNGLSATIHAIGDRAVHDVLDIFEAVRAEETARGQAPDSLRHRIEHVQLIHPDDRNRLAELDIIASMQPIHAVSDMVMADKFWGERAKWSYAWRTMQASGALVVFGSDTPVEPIDPLLGICAAVTRRSPDGGHAPDGWYPEQKFTLMETLHAFTLAAALTSGQEARQGSITVGKLADLTLFDRDIFADDDAIHQASIVGTIVDGQFRYRDF